MAGGGELEHVLKKRHLTMMAIGGAVGAGLFVGSGQAIHDAGPAALVAYAFAGGLIILTMRMLGEMVVARPMSGSFADYGRMAIGNWAGFAVGWLYWYSWVIIVGIETVTGGAIVHRWIPGVPAWLLSLLLLVAMTALSLTSVKSFAEAEFWFVAIKIAAVVAFMVAGIAFVVGLLPGHDAAGISNLTSHGGFVPNGLAATASAVVVVIFSLGGAEVVTIAAAESAEPGKVVARAATQVIIRICFFFVGSILLVVTILPWNTTRVLDSPYVGALEKMGLSAAGTVMNVVILLSVLSVMNAALYTSSRMLFVLTKRGEAPRGLVKLSKRNVPYRAILLGSAIGFGAVVAQRIFSETVFTFLVDSAGSIAIYMYILIGISQIRLRRKMERESPELLTFKMWWFPYLSYFTIAAFGCILVAMAFLKSARPGLVASLISLAVVLVAYVLFRRFRPGAGSAQVPEIPVQRSPDIAEQGIPTQRRPEHDEQVAAGDETVS